jgi:hypothetical protein
VVEGWPELFEGLCHDKVGQSETGYVRCGRFPTIYQSKGHNRAPDNSNCQMILNLDLIMLLERNECSLITQPRKEIWRMDAFCNKLTKNACNNATMNNPVI